MSLAFLFDAIGKIDEERQKQDRISTLKTDINRIKSKCGSCDNWMHSSVCKRERTRLVTCGDMICDDFKMKSFYIEMITEKEKEIADLSQ